MDKMDRMLHSLPRHVPAPELAVHIRAVVRRRHRNRRALRWTAAVVLTLSGLWLVSPAALWLSSNEMYASGTPWLASSLEYLNLESVDIFDRLWNGMFSLQNLLGSSLAVSIWVGLLLLCLAMFCAIDGQALQNPMQTNIK
jgi:predicted anti-sigma-YlaC factor YlaD